MRTIQTVKKPCGHVLLGNTKYSRKSLAKARIARCMQCPTERNDRILQDPKVKRYVTVIRSKPKSGGLLSDNTKQKVGLYLNQFIQYMEINSPSELLELRIKTKDQHLIDDKLEEFSQIRLGNKSAAQYIRGFFRANRNPLNVYIDNHTVDRQPPPSEERLSLIYQNATLGQKALMSLQADAGERIRATALTKIKDLPDLNEQQDIHVIIFDQERTKIHREHISYYSENTAELIRKYIQDNSKTSSDPLFPNYRNIWRPITDYSKSIGTYLKSHHLRKRFVHIAERTPMPIADINYLMGDAKQGVHCAEAYSYTIEDELAEEYRKFLLPSLAITNNRQSPHLIRDLDSNKENTARRETLKEDLRRANETIDSLNRTVRILSNQLSKTI